MTTHESEMKKQETVRQLTAYLLYGVFAVMFIAVLVLAIKLGGRPDSQGGGELTPMQDLLNKAEEEKNKPSPSPPPSKEPIITLPSAEPGIESAAPVVKYVVTNKRVNVRAEADSSSEKLTTLDAGTVLPLVGYADDWTIVNYDGRTAYVYSIYVDETDSAP